MPVLRQSGSGSSLSGLFKADSFRLGGSHSNLNLLAPDGSSNSLLLLQQEDYQDLDDKVRESLPVQPRSHQYVLGITSLWMLNITWHGLVARIKGPRSFASMFLTVSICIASLISTACWREPERTPLLGQADIVCAHGIFVQLLARHAWRHPKRRLSLPAQAALPCLVVACFKAGRRFADNGHFLAKAWCHLTFRLVGYWWAYLGIEPPPGLAKFFLSSAFYYGHCGLNLYTLRNEKSDVCVADYPRGCLKLLAMIAGVKVLALSLPQ